MPVAKRKWVCGEDGRRRFLRNNSLVWVCAERFFERVSVNTEIPAQNFQA